MITNETLLAMCGKRQVRCVSCDNDADFEVLPDPTTQYNVVCGVCGWKLWVQVDPVKGDMRYNVTIINEEREHVTHEGLPYNRVITLVNEMNAVESYLLTAYWDKDAE